MSSSRSPRSIRRTCPSRYEGDFASYSELEGSNTVRQSVRATRNVLYSREARRKIERVIEREKPDVAHLHNIYHHLSPSILGPLRKHRFRRS